MSRTLLLAVIFLAITSTTLGDGYGSRTSSSIQVPKIRNFDNSPFARSVGDDTFVINFVIASQKENHYLDLLIEMYSNSVPLIVQKLGKKYWPLSSGSGLRINTIDFVLSFYDTTAQINVEELEFAFGSMWSPRARIILWVWDATDRTMDEIFEDFWAHNVLNVDLIIQDSSGESWEVFTYNPFVIRDDGARGSIEKLQSNSRELFPDKLADLYNHSIPISVFDQLPTTILSRDSKHLDRGPDTELLRIISRQMNFNVDLKTANSPSISYVTTLKNSERTGVVGDIINGRSEVVWNRQYLDNLPTKFVEFTYPRHTVKTCIVVRKAGQVPMMLRALLPFPWVIWYAVFTVLGVFIILMNLAKERDIFTRVIRLLLFQNLGRIPRRNFNRIYSISWIFWSLLMAVIYEANLVRDLMFPMYYKDIDTPQDLYDRNMTLFVGQNIPTVVNNSEIPNWRRLADRTEVELNFTHCVDRVNRHEAVACATREFIATFIPMWVEYRGQNGPRLYKMKEHLSDHWEAFTVKRGLPYLEKFDNFVEKLVECGIYQKWLDTIIDWSKLHEPTYDDTTLTMKHFQGVFCIFFIGIVISTLTFILEIYCSGRFSLAGH